MATRADPRRVRFRRPERGSSALTGGPRPPTAKTHADAQPRTSRDCVVCGNDLGPHPIPGRTTCHRMACLTTLAVRAREVAERQRQANIDAAVLYFTNKGEAIGAGPVEKVGVVPFFERSLVAADPDRVATFRETLTAAMAQAETMRLEAPRQEPEPGPDLVAAMGWGCAMCAGGCCQRGNTHAFLDAEELAFRLAASPQTSPAELLAAYFAALPERSVEGSCVFHGECGCVLPRTSRARICNTWCCAGLDEWANAIEAAPKGRLCVASVDEGVVRRAVVIENGDAVPYEKDLRT